MNLRIIFSLTLVCGVSVSLGMGQTKYDLGQIYDSLVLGTEVIPIKQHVLSVRYLSEAPKLAHCVIFPEIDSISHRPARSNIAPERQIVKLVVVDDVIYIKEIEPYYKDMLVETWNSNGEVISTPDFEAITPSGAEITNRLEVLTKQTADHTGMVPVKWFSGTIDGAKDFVNKDCFLNLVTLIVSKGKITSVEKTANNPKELDNPEELSTWVSSRIPDSTWRVIKQIRRKENMPYILLTRNALPDSVNLRIVSYSSSEFDKIAKQISSVINGIPKDKISSKIYTFSRQDGNDKVVPQIETVRIYPDQKNIEFFGAKYFRY